MKKMIYLFLLILGVTGCSVESIDSTENLLTADAKFKAQEVDKSLSFLEAEICAGEAPVFVFNFPQNQNGPHLANTDIKIQIETYPGSDEWLAFKDLSFSGTGPQEYMYEDDVVEIGSYSFRAKISAGGFDYKVTLDVVDCSNCKESFNYVVNPDDTYTFTYIPEEDMVGAEVVFTFAQSVVATGYDWPNWNGKSSTRSEIMDLDACEIYTWTLTLTPDCSGNSNESNVWTDFKVNDISKKGDLANIVTNCN